MLAQSLLDTSVPEQEDAAIKQTWETIFIGPSRAKLPVRDLLMDLKAEDVYAGLAESNALCVFDKAQCYVCYLPQLLLMHCMGYAVSSESREY